MTRAVLALALAAVLAGCGKYGPPVRASEAGRAGVSGVTAGHPAGCQDPDHHHGTDAGSDAGPAHDHPDPEAAP
jgi:hypothetical protein